MPVARSLARIGTAAATPAAPTMPLLSTSEPGSKLD